MRAVPSPSIVPVLVIGIAVWLGCHVAVAPYVYHNFTRDSDVGLWFCGGLLLGELSMFGLVARLQYGDIQWRVLIAAIAVVGLIHLSLHSAMLCDRMSRDAQVSWLFFAFSTTVLFATIDLMVLGMSKFAVVRVCPNKHEVKQETQALEPFRFGIPFLMVALALTAWVALIWQRALSTNVVAYWSIQNYHRQGVQFLAILALFFWTLHIALLWATLRPHIRWGVVCSILLVVLGTEAIRRLEQWRNRPALDYLNWEFPMIVFGFLILHVVVGVTFRWLGWEIRTVS